MVWPQTETQSMPDQEAKKEFKSRTLTSSEEPRPCLLKSSWFTSSLGRDCHSLLFLQLLFKQHSAALRNPSSHRNHTVAAPSADGSSEDHGRPLTARCLAQRQHHSSYFVNFTKGLDASRPQSHIREYDQIKRLRACAKVIFKLF